MSDDLSRSSGRPRQAHARARGDSSYSDFSNNLSIEALLKELPTTPTPGAGVQLALQAPALQQASRRRPPSVRSRRAHAHSEATMMAILAQDAGGAEAAANQAGAAGGGGAARVEWPTRRNLLSL